MTLISSYLNVLLHAGAELSEVGGPVRDKMLGRVSKDHDILCRHLSIQKITRLLRPLGKVAMVGKSFGVIKFSPHKDPDAQIDIALPRRERSTGDGHRDFNVDYDPELPVEEDLGRRDFTINAMALSLSDGKLTDPFGGQKDLKNKILRQVFPNAFKEDPLRLIRAIQFTARFDLKIEDETWAAMKEHASLIETVSGERISLELAKLMAAKKPSRGFELMHECGLLKKILPELAALKGIEQDKQPGDDVFSHTMRALDAARCDDALIEPGNLELLFAVLFHDIGKARTARFHAPANRVVFFGHQIVSKKLARRWMEKMKLSVTGVNTENILRLIENHMFETKASFTDRAIRRFIAKIGTDLILRLMDMRLVDNRGGKHPSGIKGVQRLKDRIIEEMAKKPPFGPKDLAINGHDIMKMGVGEGPIVGLILSELVERVLDEPGLNEKTTLLALANEMKENPAALKEMAKIRKKEEEMANG